MKNQSKIFIISIEKKNSIALKDRHKILTISGSCPSTVCFIHVQNACEYVLKKNRVIANILAASLVQFFYVYILYSSFGLFFLIVFAEGLIMTSCSRRRVGCSQPVHSCSFKKVVHVDHFKPLWAPRYLLKKKVFLFVFFAIPQLKYYFSFALSNIVNGCARTI